MLESLALILNAMTIAQIMLAGALVNIRKIIWYAFCRLVTSVVRRVTSPAVLNLSIFANENVWMWLNMDSRRFFANPAEAFAPYRPPAIPANRPTAAAATMKPPTL